MVVIADMEHLIASAPVLCVANTCSPVAHLVEVGQLLRVEVKEVPRGLVLVAVGWLLLLEG